MIEEIKKVLVIVLICALILTGCNKNNNIDDNNTDVIPNDTPEISEPEDTTIYTKTVISVKIYEYATEIYVNGSYKTLEIVDGTYYLPLEDLMNNYNYDFTKLLKTSDTNIILNAKKSYVEYDVNNVKGLEYKEYPIVLRLYWGDE